jgi:hypothetical protein
MSYRTQRGSKMLAEHVRNNILEEIPSAYGPYMTKEVLLMCATGKMNQARRAEAFTL